MSIHSLLEEPDVDDSYDNIKLLIESDRSVLQSTDNQGRLPIHVACENPHITLKVIQLLLDSWPESISQPDHIGSLPIHCLCANKGLDEVVSVDILTLLLEAFPESVERGNSMERLPIHNAARGGKSPTFLKILVKANPQSVRIFDRVGRMLPTHSACISDNCRLDSVKYLLDIYPESIKIDTGGGWLSIHLAARSNGPQKDEIIEHLLSKDPTCASKVTENGLTPIHLACFANLNLTTMQLLFDAYPEAVLKRDNNGNTPLEHAREYRIDIDNDDYLEDVLDYLNSQKAQVINFLQTQQSYANISPESLVVQDENGWTRLHHALKSKVPLGTIKLLVKKSVNTLQLADRNNVFSLHIACEFSSVKVVQYLMETMDMLDKRTWNQLDVNDDSILHYACRGGNCEVVKYLLDKQNPYVTERNVDQKLPIQLFCESRSSSNIEGDRQTNIGGEEGRPRIAPELFGT